MVQEEYNGYFFHYQHIGDVVEINSQNIYGEITLNIYSKTIAKEDYTFDSPEINKDDEEYKVLRDFVVKLSKRLLTGIIIKLISLCND